VLNEPSGEGDGGELPRDDCSQRGAAATNEHDGVNFARCSSAGYASARRRKLDMDGRFARTFAVAAAAFATLSACGVRTKRSAATSPASAPAGLAAPSVPQATIFAAAPIGMPEADLGVPRDAHFRAFQGLAGRSLFVGAAVARVPVNQFAYDSLVVDNDLTLEANLSAWKMISASVGSGDESRYAAYRAYRVAWISTLDDRTAIAAAPPGATYYAARIFFGHSFEAVVTGAARRFHAGVAADFASIGGSVKMFAKSRRLGYQVTGTGLAPVSTFSNDPIFARNVDDVAKSYTTSGTPPTAIFVEYRTIPGVVPPAAARVKWLEPLQVTVRYRNLYVIKDGSAGTTMWSAQAFCDVDGEPADLVNPVVLDAVRVVNGKNHVLGWNGTFRAAPGSTVTCGLRGKFWDTWTAMQSIAEGRSESFVVQPGTRELPISASLASTAYNLEATVDVK